MKNFSIGRNPNNDIVYSDPSISGNHADLTIGDNGQMIFTDHSTNGTIINGQTIRQGSVNVNFGDSIVFPGGMQLDWNHIASMVQPPQPPQPQMEYSNVNSYSESYAEPYSSGENFEPSYSGGSLSFNLTFSEAFSTGLRNSLSLFATLLLFILTCWVPYINIGTFIAIKALPAYWASNSSFSPFSIYDSKYRKLIGDYVILAAIRGGALAVCLSFLVIPAIVMSLAWGLSDLFCIYKGKSFLDSLRASNQATYGHKWKIVGIYFVFILAYMIVASLLQLLFMGLMAESMNGAVIAIDIVVMLVLGVIVTSVGIGIQGSIWKQLTGYND